MASKQSQLRDVISGINKLRLDEVKDVLEHIATIYAERASDAMDEQFMIRTGFESGFTSMGVAKPPQDMGNGILAIFSTVNETGKERHECVQYTVKSSLDSDDERYVFDSEVDTCIANESVKIAGLRKTVSLHGLPDGAVLIRHDMKKGNGFGHERLKVQGYIIHHTYNEETGEILSTKLERTDRSVERRLPVPTNMPATHE